MPKYLRELNTSWTNQADDAPLPGRVLRDLMVDRDRCISIYMLRDESFEEDLNRVVVALTIAGKHCEVFQYGLIDEVPFFEIGLKIKNTPGATIDDTVNSLHWDIEDPSVQEVAILALRLQPQPSFKPREIGKLIQKYVAENGTSRTDLPERVEEKLIEWEYLQREPHDEEACKAAQERLETYVNAWRDAVDAFSAAIRENPAATAPDGELQRAIDEAFKALKDPLTDARRLWRSHPS